ncbi:MAG: GNAT family N-acetyltransferase [Verrucomicrobiales bacterium]|nr:GNAT family N-acetyltransferase [Verrucomicrobiales bacterium]
MSESLPDRPPTLEGGPIRLRALGPEDAPRIVQVAGAREIADTTISVPHPYPPEAAVEWITKVGEQWTAGTGAIFGVETCDGNALVGSIGLREIDRAHSQAELGFYVGVPWWGRGYATAAIRALLPFAFGPLGLNRVYAHHMVRNPASGRVLEKTGFRREGLLRQRVRKWGVFEDVVILALLRREWAGP